MPLFTSSKSDAIKQKIEPKKKNEIKREKRRIKPERNPLKKKKEKRKENNKTKRKNQTTGKHSLQGRVCNYSLDTHTHTLTHTLTHTHRHRAMAGKKSAGGGAAVSQNEKIHTHTYTLTHTHTHTPLILMMTHVDNAMNNRRARTPWGHPHPSQTFKSGKKNKKPTTNGPNRIEMEGKKEKKKGCKFLDSNVGKMSIFI